MSDITKDIETLLDLTREAHEAIKDLRAVLRDYEKVKAGLPKMVGVTVRDTIGEQIEVGLEAYNAALAEQIEKADKAIHQRFDKVTAILLSDIQALHDHTAAKLGEADVVEGIIRKRVKRDWTKEG